jgi:NTP pyrophosphatase (non-canonical NTP hydrolase)
MEASDMTPQVLKSFGVLSVDEYVNIAKEVWKGIHSRRTVLDYVLHVLDHASKLGEAIRRDDADLILREIGQTANWLFGLVAKLNDDKIGWESRLNIQTMFSHMIWSKYPGLCPHCFQRIYVLNEGKKVADDLVSEIKGKCKYCLSDYPKVEKRSADPEYKKKIQSCEEELRSYAQKSLEEIPKSLQKMEAMFQSIYEPNIALATPESIGFHILEETGEMSRAVIDIYTDKSPDIPMERKQYMLCDEIAEVFAWLCSLTLKVRNGAKTFDKYRNRLVSYTLPVQEKEKLAKYVGLEQILWVNYRNKKDQQYECPYCRSHTCKCKLEFAWEKETNDARENQ